MIPPDLAILKQAAADFRYLLNRGYPRVASLALVGNRYHLDKRARQLLHRGVFPGEVAAARKAKLRRLVDLAGLTLAVDGHNVLITLECALKGLPLVAADDGFIRDVAQVSRAFRATPTTMQALNLLARYLGDCRSGQVTLLFDAPLSKSGELARRAEEILQEAGVPAEARAVPVPERELLEFPGPIATSDTHLLDLADRVADLAGEIIRDQAILNSFLLSLQ